LAVGKCRREKRGIIVKRAKIRRFEPPRPQMKSKPDGRTENGWNANKR
jgi:hypothetical protein